MATQYAFGKIVTNGLVLALDAADKNSYPGSGTTWRDMAGNSNNGTLINGPTFNSANGGAIVFDGTNDRVDLPDIGVTELSAFSISCWVRTSIGAIYPTVYAEGTPGDSPSNLFILYYGDTEGASGGVRVWFGGTSRITYSTSVVDNIWRHLVYTQINNSNRSVYLNGIQIGTNTDTITHTVTNSNIGAFNNLGSFIQFFKGDISNLQLYNKGLLVSEILQNYNAQKSRFNL
jgi:hypothetical protein